METLSVKVGRGKLWEVPWEAICMKEIIYVEDLYVYIYRERERETDRQTDRDREVRAWLKAETY